MIKNNTKWVVSIITLLLIACGQPTTTSETETISSTYVCPMRCENSEAHEPGRCSVCNMMLVKSIELDSMSGADTPTDQSVYNIDYSWTNQNNDQVRLKQYSEKYQLVSMIFTHCDYACPNLISDMLNIDDDILEDKRALVDFFLISIDPERDTPQQLADYADNMDLNLERWSLLNGEVTAVNSIASKLGISYKKFENGAFGHSNIISLLNKKGEIIYQLEGIHADRTKLVNLINSL